MGNLLFSPSGRINSSDFMKGATVLIVITLVLALLPVISPGLALLNIVTLVFLWCWVVLWVKRYHDGGKTGWMCIIPIIIYLIVGGVAGWLVTQSFVDADAVAEAQEAIAEATEANDIGAMFKASMGANGVTKTGTIVVALVSAAVSYAIAFLFNKMIAGDAHDNQFGPHAGTADTFN
ncbi:MAG: DUF805 domain-containing protein [Litorimonas sp.]